MGASEKCGNYGFYTNGNYVKCELPKGHKTKWHQTGGTGIYGNPYKLLWRDLLAEEWTKKVSPNIVTKLPQQKNSLNRNEDNKT